jgi:Tfp pilus assembly protein FimT
MIRVVNWAQAQFRRSGSEVEMSKQKSRSERGITLIELISIVVIIGIVAAMAVPRFATTISRLKFRTSARDIVSKMRLARSNAVTHKQPFGVYFDDDAKSVTLFLDSNNPGANTFEVSDSILDVDTLPDGFVYVGTDFGLPTLVYQPNGSATQTGHVYFMSYDENDGVNIGTIDVLSSTGRTKIQSLNYY